MFYLLLLVILILLVVFIVFVIKTAIHNNNCSADKFNFKFDVFFVSGNINHNNINNLQKGKCLLKVENGLMSFIQGDNVIQDNVLDIESIRTWVYEGYDYFAIKMKTHSEYMFSLLIDSAADNQALVNTLKAGMVKALQLLASKLNVEYTDCGESQPADDDDDDDE